MATQENGAGSALAQLFPPEDVRLIADLGFLALAAGRRKTARQLFNALLVLRRGSEVSIVAEASFQLAMGESNRAVEILRTAEPSDRINALLAVALLGARKSDEAMELLLQSAADPDGSQFSVRILKELQAKDGAGGDEPPVLG